MKLVENTEKYAVVEFNEMNLATTDEKIVKLGGRAYQVGEICGSPSTEERHEIRKEVLRGHGFEVDEADLIVIKDLDWINLIDKDIADFENK